MSIGKLLLNAMLCGASIILLFQDDGMLRLKCFGPLWVTNECHIVFDFDVWLQTLSTHDQMQQNKKNRNTVHGTVLGTNTKKYSIRMRRYLGQSASKLITQYLYNTYNKTRSITWPFIHFPPFPPPNIQRNA